MHVGSQKQGKKCGFWGESYMLYSPKLSNTPPKGCRMFIYLYIYLYVERLLIFQLLAQPATCTITHHVAGIQGFISIALANPFWIAFVQLLIWKGSDSPCSKVSSRATHSLKLYTSKQPHRMRPFLFGAAVGTPRAIGSQGLHLSVGPCPEVSQLTA